MYLAGVYEANANTWSALQNNESKDKPGRRSILAVMITIRNQPDCISRRSCLVSLEQVYGGLAGRNTSRTGLHLGRDTSQNCAHKEAGLPSSQHLRASYFSVA